MASGSIAPSPTPWDKSHMEETQQELYVWQHKDVSAPEEKVSLNSTPCGQTLCLGMNVPIDLQPLIEEHWFQYPPPDPIVCVLLGVTMTFLTIGALVGNLTVIVVYCRCRRLHTPSNIFVLNLAIADLMMMGKAPIFIVNSFLQKPFLGYVGCQIYGFVSLVSGLAAIWFLAGISWERYRVMKSSYSTEEMQSRVQVRAAVSVIWLLSTIAAILPLVGWNRYVPEGFMFGCTCDYLSSNWKDKSFIMVLLLLAWAFPMTFILYTYTYIALKVKESCEELRRMNSTNNSTNSQTHRKIENRVLRTVMTLVLLWTISWTPYAIVVLLPFVVDESFITPMISTIPSVFCKVSACINPYIYGLCLPSFRRELARALIAGLREAKNVGGSNKEPMESTNMPPFLPQPSPQSEPSQTSVHRFMLANGDIVLGKTYEDAKQKNMKQKHPLRDYSNDSRHYVKFHYPVNSQMRPLMAAEFSGQVQCEDSQSFFQLNEVPQKYLQRSISDKRQHKCKDSDLPNISIFSDCNIETELHDNAVIDFSKDFEYAGTVDKSCFISYPEETHPRPSTSKHSLKDSGQENNPFTSEQVFPRTFSPDLVSQPD